MDEKLMSDIVNIVKKIFPSEIQNKRIIKEIQLLRELNQKFYKVSLKNSVLGLQIMIDLTDLCMQNYSKELKLNFNSIIFEILLDQKFPFNFPKVFCRTPFTEPSIADGRDILSDVLKTIWGPQVLLHQIVQKLPPFLLEISKIQEQAQLQQIGKFHLGEEYNLEDFLIMDSVNVFTAKQLINKQYQSRYIIISPVNILSFEIPDQKKNLIRLLSYSQLQNLKNIKRKKDDNKLVIFQWKDSDSGDNVSEQSFQLGDSQKLIDLILKYMRQSGIKIFKNTQKKPDLTMADVTGKADFDGLNIALLMENISILESEIAVELSVNSINTLMTLYQKAIEYFSALNDETYINYINRLQELLSKQEVQIVLDSQSEAQTKVTSEEKKEDDYQEDQDFQISSEEPQEFNNQEKIIEEQKKEIEEQKQQYLSKQLREEQKQEQEKEIEEQKLDNQEKEEQNEEPLNNQEQNQPIIEQKEEKNDQNQQDNQIEEQNKEDNQTEEQKSQNDDNNKNKEQDTNEKE